MEQNMTPEKEVQYKKALQAARDHVVRLRGELAAFAEPVAVVGMACRFPGVYPEDAKTPLAFYRQLMAGTDSVVPVPPERLAQWQGRLPENERPRLAGLRQAALLGRDPYAFDAAFFEIAPAEAQSTDPQHRLMLELAQEALWDAGLPQGSEPGADTGVFCGKSGTDFLFDILGTARASAENPYTLTGNMHSSLPGRIAWFFDWHGPCVSVETACSTALVAVLNAVESLRKGDCHLALAGAVNLLMGPTPSHWLNAMHALAPDGRCKAFGAEADGFGRGEGGGALVLQRLSAAKAQGSRIHALILGGAVGADGRSRNFAAPSAAGQRAVIRRALENAGVAPQEVAYVETHGTGTPIGDPIEAESLADAYGASGAARPGPLLIGSVKSNVAHLESAAGMAALIKTIMAVREGNLPPSLHAQTPNPLIDWPELGLGLCQNAQDWPRGYGRRVAGVSGFGISGSLAHVLIAQAQPVEEQEPALPEPVVRLLPLSARGDAELAEAAKEAAERLAAGAPFDKMCDAAANARPHDARFPARLAVCATAKEAPEALRQAASGKSRRAALLGRYANVAPPLIFLYSGQGSQTSGMGRHLYRLFPEFRAVLDRCEAIAAPRLGHSLLEVLFAGDDARLFQTRVAQPAIYSHQAALTALLASRGVRPQAVMGHSVGEYAAAQAAGIVSLEEGLEIALKRGELAQSVTTPGGMSAVLGAPDQVAAVIAGIEGVSIAAINGAETVTLAGAARALEAALTALRETGMESRPMPVSHAFHCPLIEPVLPEFLAFLRARSFAAHDVPFLSSARAAYLEKGESVDWAEYFVFQMRAPVQFWQAVRAAKENIFLEIGAGPTLSGFGRQIRPEAQWLFAQNGGGSESAAQEKPLALALARLFALGCPLDFGWLAATPRQPEAAPMPVFQNIRLAPPQAPVPHIARDEVDVAATIETGHPAFDALVRAQQAALAEVMKTQQAFLRHTQPNGG
jgi:acyl transferase domain-containing protein